MRKRNLISTLFLSILFSNAFADTITEPIRTFSGHTRQVQSVAFSPDGRYALSGSGDKTLKLWEINSGTEIRSFNGHTDWISSVTFSPDGQYALSGSADKVLKMWDVNSGTEIRTFTGHTDTVNSVAFSPDGQYVLSGSSDETLKLWDVNSGAELLPFRGHIDLATSRIKFWVTSVAFSPDGRYALSGSGDKTLKLWDVNSGAEIRTFTGHTDRVKSVAFSPDGQYVLSSSYYPDKTLKLWNVNSGAEIRTFSGHTGHVNSVAFTPDGQYVLSGSDDRTLRLWDVNSGTEIRTFSGPTLYVNSVAVSPDGRYVLSGSNDKMLRLWDTGLVTTRLINISTRASIQGGPNDVIAGFIITGTGTLKVIIRGWGIGADVDPTLLLQTFPEGKTIASNNNWQDSSRASEIKTLPKNLRLTNPTDAGLLLDLPAGLPASAYTAILSSVGAKGRGLIGVNEVESSDTAKLINISTRAPIQGNADDVVAGFILTGTGNQKVLIRGWGLDTGVNPSITLYSQAGEVIAFNNDWQNGTSIAEMNALPENLRLSKSTDAALLLELSVGVYTVRLSSVAAKGQGLIGVNVVD